MCAQANPKSRLVYSTCAVLLMVEENTDIIPASEFSQLAPPRLLAPLIGNTDYTDVADTIRMKPVVVSGKDDRYQKFPALGYIAVQVSFMQS